MKIFEFKVIEDNKETYVQIEATSMYNALDVIIQEENISHIYSIKDINGYERWDFTGNLFELRRMRKKFDFYDSEFYEVLRGKDEKIH